MFPYRFPSKSPNFQNTCDPQILNSFIPSGMLATFVLMRFAAIFLFLVLLCVRPFGEPVGRLVALLRPKEPYKAKYIKNAKASKKGSGVKAVNYDHAKSTTFDANEKRPPIISSPIDHTLR
jgi:hypothetical protein